jgi:hypothetical protein
MTELTLLTRAECHLCETMKTVVARVQQRHPLVLNEIDVSARPDLEREFGNDIPVLMSGDRIIARHRITTSQLTAALIRPSEPPAKTQKGGR